MTKILRNHIVLAVNDAARSAEFYTDVLGFHEVLEGGGWRFVERDACLIMLGECPDETPAAELGNHSYVAYFVVDDADAMWREIRSNTADVASDIADKPWGMREFAVTTPDGHRMTFGQDLE